MTTSELLSRRDVLYAELTNAPAAKRGTQWYADRVNELARLNRQLARLGAIPAPLVSNTPGRAAAITSPADHAELAAHAGAWQGEAPGSDDAPTADHDAQDEAWWTVNTPTRFDRYAVIGTGRRHNAAPGLIPRAGSDLSARTSIVGHTA